MNRHTNGVEQGWREALKRYPMSAGVALVVGLTVGIVLGFRIIAPIIIS